MSANSLSRRHLLLRAGSLGVAGWRAGRHVRRSMRAPLLLERLESRLNLGFLAPLPLDTGASPYSVAVGDVNGDGRLDLATANFNDDTMSLLLGNGDGTFKPAQIYATAM